MLLRSILVELKLGGKIFFSFHLSFFPYCVKANLMPDLTIKWVYYCNQLYMLDLLTTQRILSTSVFQV